MEEAEACFSEFRGVCSDILDGEHTTTSSPYYAFTKAYLNEHKDKYLDRYFLISMTVAAVAREFAPVIIQNYRDKIHIITGEKLDIIELRQCYRTISYVIGYDIDRLNEMIKNQFLVVPLCDAFMHAFLNEYLLELVHVDKESERLVFQCMLDESENDTDV